MYTTNSFHFLILVSVLLFVVSCNSKQTDNMQMSMDTNLCAHQLQEGDIVLRAGNDELSNLFAQLSAKDQRYSHAAVAIKDSGKLMLYHILASPTKLITHMRKEPFTSFTNRKYNKSCAIVRLDMDSLQRKIFCNYIRLQSEKSIIFDTEFDLASDDKLYCTELIYKGIIAATNDTTFVPKTYSVSGKAYIAIDNLFLHKHAKTICEIAY